jgi:hypothetical protein
MLLIVTPSANHPLLRPEDSQSIARFLHDNAGKPVRIELKRHYGGRSGEQNAWYWGGILRTIAEETGHDENELHEYFKHKFLPKKTIHLGSEVFEVPFSTTDLNTAEFTAYIERIRMFAAQELSINVPPPLYSEH